MCLRYHCIISDVLSAGPQQADTHDHTYDSPVLETGNNKTRNDFEILVATGNMQSYPEHTDGVGLLHIQIAA
jgi:hypothetical protein